LARALPFLTSHDDIVRSLAEIAEAVALDDLSEPLPIAELGLITDSLDRIRIGASLANDELRAILATLGAARTLRKFLVARRERTPALNAACATDPELDQLERELARCFDPDGSLADRASPRLEELRAKRRGNRDRLVRRLEELMRKHEDIL